MSRRVGFEEKEVKWGDLDDEEDQEMETADKTFSTQPDENGIKTVTTYKTNEKGQKVKIVRKIKVTKKAIRMDVNVAKRRNLAKFGTEKMNVGSAGEEKWEFIPFSLKPRKREEEEMQDNLKNTLGAGQATIKCRHCNEEGKHYSLNCPKRKDIEVEGVPSESKLGNRPGPNAYVPIHRREGGGRGGGRGQGVQMGRDDSATIRVTNISEDTTEDDLRALFRPYGRTSRIYLAKDRITGVSRGFAFISYGNRQDAQAAIDGLNNKGYDNLILHVEFAQPREDHPDKPQDGRGGRGGGRGRGDQEGRGGGGGDYYGSRRIDAYDYRAT